MHKQIVQIFGMVLLLASGWSQSFAVVIEDNYWGSNNNGYGDVIGDSRYEIHNMDVNFSGGFMNVRVNTNFNAATDPYGIDFGDLFISTDGWNPYGSAPYKYDNHTNGEDWEFVFDTSAGMLYGGDFTIDLSDDLMDASRFIFRNGQEVQRRDGGTAYEGSSVNLANAGNGGYIEYNILLSSLGITDGTDIGLKWGMTCANDTIEGVVTASVPEPSSLLLFGIGLLALGAVTRRKQSS